MWSQTGHACSRLSRPHSGLFTTIAVIGHIQGHSAWTQPRLQLFCLLSILCLTCLLPPCLIHHLIDNYVVNTSLPMVWYAIVYDACLWYIMLCDDHIRHLLDISVCYNASWDLSVPDDRDEQSEKCLRFRTKWKNVNRSIFWVLWFYFGSNHLSRLCMFYSDCIKMCQLHS